jgi:hypothetical protein
MSSATPTAATLDDLRRVEGKAELIAGRIVEAGTKVVWDVDPKAKSIRAYAAATPDQPTVFGSGQVADAEPAVRGWRLPVNRVFV